MITAEAPDRHISHTHASRTNMYADPEHERHGMCMCADPRPDLIGQCRRCYRLCGCFVSPTVLQLIPPATRDLWRHHGCP